MIADLLTMLDVYEFLRKRDFTPSENSTADCEIFDRGNLRVVCNHDDGIQLLGFTGRAGWTPLAFEVRFGWSTPSQIVEKAIIEAIKLERNRQ